MVSLKFGHEIPLLLEWQVRVVGNRLEKPGQLSHGGFLLLLFEGSLAHLLAVGEVCWKELGQDWRGQRQCTSSGIESFLNFPLD